MLKLPKELFQQIVQQCLEELPNEACGILAGKNCSAERVYAMANIDKSPQTYFMEAKEQLKVMKQIRSYSLEMLAVYHSHVTSGAYPSKHDVELVFYPELSYVIVSLKEKNNPFARSFRITEGQISEEELLIE